MIETNEFKAWDFSFAQYSYYVHPDFYALEIVSGIE
jgi:hypothetical protein